MKGYYVSNGYMGIVGSRYVLFACEEDYLDFMTDED